MASSMATIDRVSVGGHLTSMVVAVLDNGNALPPAAIGLLGLTFLSSISRFVSFDFDKLVFEFGDQDSLLSPIQWVSFCYATCKYLLLNILIRFC